MKDVIRAGGFVLSHGKLNLLISPVNKQTEESKRWNEEENHDKDSLTDREESQGMNKNFRGEWKEYFI